MTETTSRAGDEPAQDAEMNAISAFTNAFNGFQSEVKKSLKHQEERLTMLNAKTMSYGRPALSARAEVEAPHQKAFNAYLRTGDDDGLRGLTLEGKAMSTAVAADGAIWSIRRPRTASSRCFCRPRRCGRLRTWCRSRRPRST